MTYTPQVDARHYRGRAYSSAERWNSYFHQIEGVQKTSAQSLLEVGPGPGVVTRELTARGYRVTTLDIAEDLHPDVVGSVTDIPLPDRSVDLVLAAEVLEHLRTEDLPKALQEIHRVCRMGAVISLPRPGYVFLWSMKIPLFPEMSVAIKLPFFWEQHVFTGEHYWELGKRGTSVAWFVEQARRAGLALSEESWHRDDPAHHFFRFSRL